MNKGRKRMKKKKGKLVFRILFALIALAMLAWFAVPIAYGVLNVGNMAGIGMCLWLLLLCIAPFTRAMKSNGFTLVVYRFINCLFILLLAYGAACTAAMVTVSHTAPKANATAIVLGAKVEGKEPSAILAGRIEAARQYLEENPRAKAVLTGGRGTDEQLSEAHCMYNKLMEEGVGSERLYTEERATNTEENMRYTRLIMDSVGMNKNVAIVTDGFHQFRARLLAQKKGYSGDIGAVNAKTELLFLPTCAVREWFAIPTVFFE